MNAEEEAELLQTVARVRELEAGTPTLGVVLGSGLGGFADALTGVRKIPYSDLPHFPDTRVSGHGHHLCFGRAGTIEIACLQGRVHAYEGHSLSRVVLGVRLLAALGCRAVLLTNAAGGIRDDLAPGSLMLIADHLNLTGRNPLVGLATGWGTRFPDMTAVYDHELRAVAQRAADQLNLDLREGVYAGLLGPSYETPAEIRMLRTLGADAVGMSTVLEAIALRELGVRVAAVSVITNRAAGLSGRPLNHAEVELTAERVRRAFIEFLNRWATLIGLEVPA